MSNLLTEINRMRNLMGLKNSISESFLNKKILLKEGNTIGQIMEELNVIFRKEFKDLTQEELENLSKLVDEYNSRFPDNKIEFKNGLDNLGIKKLTNFISTEVTTVLDEFFNNTVTSIYRSGIADKAFVSVDDAVKNILKTSDTTFITPEGALDTFGALSFIYQKGGVKNSEISREYLILIKDRLQGLSKELSPDNAFKKYMNDVVVQIDEVVNNKPVVKNTEVVTTEIVNSSKKIAEEQKIKSDEISKKLEELSNSDQTMRQGDEMDVNVDITNQTKLKELMGDNPEEFIKNLDSFEDLTNLWVIVQHSDNDLTFQKNILEILKNNQQTLSTKFSNNSNDIKSGIAMLEDRVSVNSNTSVVGYRDTGMDDFGDLSKGKQTYGSQGGINENGEWIPRPIELEGKIYFFESPQQLLNDVDFLNKLNIKRAEMGLSSMEDYLKMMNKTDNFIDEPIEMILTKGDAGLQRIFSKSKGIFYSEGIEIIRNLINNYLKDYQKLYKEGAPAKEIQDYINALNLLKERFGENKIYTGLMDGKSGTKKITLNDFILEVDQKFKRLYDENGNWSPLNKLDTNWTDMPIEITKFIKTVLSQEEYDNFLKKINDYYNSKIETDKLKLRNELEIDLNKIKEKMLKNEEYVKNWTKRVDEITKNIRKNTEKGNLSEKKVNKLLEKNGINVEYAASEGSPIDVLLSIDAIVNDIKGIFNGTTGRKTLQTKTAQKIEEGEFEILKDGTRGKWIAKSGTGKYRIEIMPNQNIYKSSQIDLAGFHDPNSGITIITGKKPTLVRDANDKVIYDKNRFPLYNNDRLTLPGAKLDRPKPGERTVNFYIDGPDNILVNK